MCDELLCIDIWAHWAWFGSQIITDAWGLLHNISPSAGHAYKENDERLANISDSQAYEGFRATDQMENLQAVETGKGKVLVDQ